jgi:hypothetical protein
LADIQGKRRGGFTLVDQRCRVLETLGVIVITAGICYQERNRAAMIPGLMAMLTDKRKDSVFLRMFLALRR